MLKIQYMILLLMSFAQILCVHYPTYNSHSLNNATHSYSKKITKKYMHLKCLVIRVQKYWLM